MTGAKPGFLVAVATKKGRPSNNEDNFFVNGVHRRREDPEDMTWGHDIPIAVGLFAVCDGMGGMAAGEKASLGVVSALMQQVKDLVEDSPQDVMKAIAGLSRGLRHQGKELRKSMGTTLSMLIANRGQLDLYNVGDSPIYHYHDGVTTLVSQEHTVAQSMRNMGIEPSNVPGVKGQLTQYLGMGEEEFSISPYHCSIELQPGSKLLVCSDGVSDVLTPQDLTQVLGQELRPAQLAQRLVDQALARGSADNVTALVLIQQ